MISVCPLIEQRSPGRPFPQRHRTTQVTIHRFGSPEIGFSADEMQGFFLRDPEGVATVTLPGDYSSKLPTIERWRESGVPHERLAQAWVPYHLCIDVDGSLVQFLPWLARGRHDRFSNRKSIGVAVIGDFREHPPTEEQVFALRNLLRWMFTDQSFRREAKIDQGSLFVRGHDDSLIAQHLTPKGCPGHLMPYSEIASWAAEENVINIGHGSPRGN